MTTGDAGGPVSWEVADELVRLAETHAKEGFGAARECARLFATGWVLDRNGEQFLPPVSSRPPLPPYRHLFVGDWRWRLPVRLGGDPPDGSLVAATPEQLDVVAALLEPPPEQGP